MKQNSIKIAGNNFEQWVFQHLAQVKNSGRGKLGTAHDVLEK